ncbi:hypothetical protein ABPG75_013390 [Micractinium tetrahymenae]
MAGAACALPGALRPPAKRQRRSGGLLACRALAKQTAEADVVVVGGGAAGLAAAHFAAVSGARVRVLEKMDEAGKKICISGGTRCNVLPAEVDLQRDYFTESSQSALRAIFSTWSLDDCQYWLTDRHQVGIPLVLEAATNKYFPASNSGAEVRDKLVAACQRHGVRMQYGAALQDLATLPGGGWRVQLADGGAVDAARVVLATGGLSYAKLGTTGDGFRVLRQHGHALHEPYAALTPLLGQHPGGQQLAGISLYDAELAAVPAAAPDGFGGGGSRRSRRKLSKKGTRAQRTAMLFTHRGFSGPAILDLSHHAVQALDRGQPPPALRMRWTPAGPAEWEVRLQGGGTALAVGVLRREGVPQRLAEALCLKAGVPLDRKLSELKRGERAALVAALTTYQLHVTGHEGYPKAEVTGGGVPLNELDCSSLESRRLPGVHVCGELCDVFGRIGGFNFYFAFVSGRLAGLAAAEGAAAASSARRAPAVGA